MKKSKSKFHQSHFAYDFVKVTGAIPGMIWMRPRIICAGNTKPPRIKGGMLISANHVSFDDPVLMLCVFWTRRIYSLATKDLYSSKWKNFFFSHMHCIQVDKDNFSMAACREVINKLKEDKVVMIFPEGQINPEGKEILGFKSGAILMAHQANKPILPAYIVPVDKWTKRRTIVIGDPVDVRELCGPIPSMDAMQKASDFLRNKELELKEYYIQKTANQPKK